jgi:hypothetical protein
MTSRRFDPITVQIAPGQIRRAHRIECSKCHAQYDVHVGKEAGALAHEPLMKAFRRTGWEIGRNQRHDLCPACASARRKFARKIETAPELETAKIIPMKTIASDPAPLAAIPPAEMSRDDRRVIFAKLSEVYVDDQTGYAAGWTDRRIADDLGAPIAWVAKVRDEMFGPAKDNEDVRKMLADAREAKAEAEAVIAATKKALGSIEAEAAGLKQKLRDVERKLVDLDRNVSKLVSLVA